MKPFSDEGRPSDWFSQKNCALQYNLLLGKSSVFIRFESIAFKIQFGLFRQG